MKNTIKGFILGAIVSSIVTGAVVFATGTEIRTLVAEFCNINIFLDQEQFIPTDVTGKVVEPFIVDGTTYLPIRAIAEAFDKDVIWDGETKEVRVFTKSEPATEAEVEKIFEENVLQDDTLQDYSINRVENVAANTWSIEFDVLPKSEYRGQWIAGNGEDDGDWIRNKGLFVEIIKINGVMTMKILGTGI